MQNMIKNNLSPGFSFTVCQRWKCTHGISEAGLESASRALLVGLWNFSCISGTVEHCLSVGMLGSGGREESFCWGYMGLCLTAYGKDLFVEVRVTASNLVARSRVNYL